MTDTTIQVELLDALAAVAGCQYLSDLHYLNRTQRLSLVRMVERVPAENADLTEWNEALRYLSGERRPQPDAEQARDALLSVLRAN